MPDNLIFEFIERIGYVIRTEWRKALLEYDLQPVHLDVLRYLAACNRYSDTPQGVAEYLEITKGTISQSIKQLETKGFVEKQADASDRRMVHLHLTEKAQALLDKLTPPPGFDDAMRNFSGQEEAALLGNLRDILAQWQIARKRQRFGVCHTCRHYQSGGAGTGQCGLTGEGLSAEDSQKICREFT
ncbi:MarR family winged helix-turn-helix transcriptional regulator [Hahella sp. HN01]|uniref:MarR family winged helix-turn-helix transcriptional regulator n=1 Tax=Hahella sp. HN01 TaxID=2847262 RepID=UPI001C1EDF36|nr:MarR family transcriptional regulator [Hahella sp. HN01]MBU6952060.1 MarR family transcriptional regulator [Hahella sp. HN01]